MTRYLEKHIIELSKLMGGDPRIDTPSNGTTGELGHNIIKQRGLSVRIHRLPYQRYTKSRDHYLGCNDILFTPYPTPHKLSVGIIGMDRKVRIELSNQGSKRRMLYI